MIARLPSHCWNFDTAAHLLVRAGFGGTPAQIETLVNQGMATAVDSLLDALPENVQPPVWAVPNNLQDLQLQIRQTADSEEKRELRKQFRQQANEELRELLHWWILRMTQTRAPLVENMTLFWHGHFATSAEKVHQPYKMWLQNETFRAHALGNFGVLTKAVSRDPAMMVWLDLVQSQKNKPNENFARELMELFTLGEGHYSENDVKESARAFTGYRIDPLSQSFRFAANQHDPTSKTFLQKSGLWNGDQIIDMILAQPACARFIVTKLWKYFVSDDPGPDLIEALASQFRTTNYELKPLLQTIVTSEEFYGAKAMNSLIKSPVRLVIQGSRTVGLPVLEGKFLQTVFRQLGQVPLYPPNVKGWEGGKSWINTATLTARYEFSRQLVEGLSPGQLGLPKPPNPMLTLAGASPQNGRSQFGFAQNFSPPVMPPQNLPPRITPPLDIGRLVTEEDRRRPEQVVRKLFVRVFQASPKPELVHQFQLLASTKGVPLDDQAIRDLVALMMSTPHYQLC
jgi:uncharacterized protein (DUF1800 family)